MKRESAGRRMTELEKKQSGVTPTITRKKGSGDTSAPVAIEPWVSGLPPLCHKVEPAAEREKKNSTIPASSS